MSTPDPTADLQAQVAALRTDVDALQDQVAATRRVIRTLLRDRIRAYDSESQIHGGLAASDLTDLQQLRALTQRFAG